ncbi:MAG: hypothetical protein U5N26_11030 [Candidatus Marinimicrobia bacterium]|nr:hypothetical protein [Candidatus Neomarinimicrobiota bacterium]
MYDDGVFTVSSEDMDGSIYASLGDSRDSMRVHIIDIDSLTLYPEAVVTDTIRPLEFFVYGCEDGGKKALIDNRVFEFELVNGHGASIDEAECSRPDQPVKPYWSPVTERMRIRLVSALKAAAGKR